MSAHFSKFGLNTYYGTPYFKAHVPTDYPLSLVLQKCRAFRRLPANLKELSKLSKRWVRRVYPSQDSDIDRCYDDDGYELDPATGNRLTDEEIDERWGPPNPALAKLKVKDIPITDGGFPDPDTWEPPPRKSDITDIDDGVTEKGVLNDIASRGRGAAAVEYGVSMEQLEGIESARRSEPQLLDILQCAPSCRMARWSDVALRHPEFFRVAGKNQDSVCLAARHASGERDEERVLKPEFVEGLLRLAVDIHDRQAKMADRSLRFLPLVIAIIGVVGSVATALIALLINKV